MLASALRLCKPRLLIELKRSLMPRASKETRVNLDRLETFRLVVQLGSFSRAAEELFLSQPAVSLQIRQLEKELGAPLIERGTNGARATEAGLAVLRFTEQVLEARGNLLRELASLQSGSSLVTIGCSASTARNAVPQLMGELQRMAPEIQLRATTLPPDETASRLLKGELDFIFTTDSHLTEKMVAEPFSIARLFIVAAPTHPLARKQRATPTEIASCPFALLPAPWTAQRRFKEWAHNQGVEIRVVTELSTYDGLKETARKGLALSLVAEASLTEDLENGTLAIVHAAGLPLEYPIYLAHRAGSLSPACTVVKAAAMQSRFGRALSRNGRAATRTTHPA